MCLLFAVLLLSVDVSVHARKALQLQQAGKYDAAILEYRAALKEDSAQPGLWTNLGASLAQRGEYNQAIQSYTEALRLDPHFEEAQVNLGLAYYKLLRWSDAARLFAAYHQRHSNDLRSGLLLADASLQLDKHHDAITVLEALEKQYPENLGIAYVLGTAYIRNNQEGLGSALIDRIMKQGDVPEVHMMMGDSYRLVHEYKKSVEEYRRALEMNSKLPLAHLRLAETTLAMGDMDGALKDFEAEYAINPNNFDLNFFLGYLHKQLGVPEKAAAFLARAAAMRPDTYQPNFQLALLARDRGNYAEARQRLENAVKHHPKEIEAHVILAQIYFRLRMKEAGKREQEAIVRLTAAEQAAERPQELDKSRRVLPIPQP